MTSNENNAGHRKWLPRTWLKFIPLADPCDNLTRRTVPTAVPMRTDIPLPSYVVAQRARPTGGTENANVFLTLSRKTLKCRAACRWLMASAKASRTFRSMAAVMILAPSLPAVGRT